MPRGCGTITRWAIAACPASTIRLSCNRQRQHCPDWVIAIVTLPVGMISHGAITFRLDQPKSRSPSCPSNSLRASRRAQDIPCWRGLRAVTSERARFVMMRAIANQSELSVPSREQPHCEPSCCVVRRYDGLAIARGPLDKPSREVPVSDFCRSCRERTGRRNASQNGRRSD